MNDVYKHYIASRGSTISSPIAEYYKLKSMDMNLTDIYLLQRQEIKDRYIEEKAGKEEINRIAEEILLAIDNVIK